MNLFRSEEHMARWLDMRGYEGGEIVSAGKLCDLAHAWWASRLAPDWRPRSREEAQGILDSLGLTGPFWRYP